ncbi:hypothetical protein JD276_07845 [Leucobacter sp. CSA1]|uniref:Uncharacterized protein n=1 Tax=Leucobacter chromiisoli TaxID=2796471 RepID=A0A934Q7U9_9MICO|nr:hypothetical protein [Leucobacter chromiisoli]MBK0418945.1 hypothetical protein [Leucobacter chromiisoli]
MERTASARRPGTTSAALRDAGSRSRAASSPLQRSRAAAALVAAATVALSLAACAPDPEPEPEVLSVTEAGGVYLEAVCPVNAAWDEADVEIDRLRIGVARGEDFDTAPFAEAMSALADASGEAAEQLDAGDIVWPEEARDEIEEVRVTLVADRKQALAVAELPAEEAAGYMWDGDAARDAAVAARTVLGLPEDPAAACARWAERRAAEDGGGAGSDGGSGEPSE